MGGRIASTDVGTILMRKAFDKANGPLGITALSAAKKTLDHYWQKVRAGDEMKNRPMGQWSGSGAGYGYGRPALAGVVRTLLNANPHIRLDDNAHALLQTWKSSLSK